jgi:hypothetical protein
MTRNRNSVVTAAGEMSSQELLQKRLASELDALRGLLKKAEHISRGGGTCKGGAPTAGKKERFLPSNQRAKPIEEDFNAPSAKRRKISTLVEQKQIRAPRMSPEERNQLAGRLSSLSGELPGHIVEFLQKQFGDADAHGEIEIDINSVEASVLFELKTRLDKCAEESKDDKLAEESKGEVVLEQEDEEYIDICGLSPIIETGSKPSSSSSVNSDTDTDTDSDGDECVDRPAQVPPEQTIATSAQPPSEPAQAVQQSTVAKKVQDVQRAAPNYMPGLLYRANLRRQLLEMERAKLPDESIHPREYGHPSLMRQLGLVLKADA